MRERALDFIVDHPVLAPLLALPLLPLAFVGIVIYGFGSLALIMIITILED